jgi:uroporphyrinogen decarboxylase
MSGEMTPRERFLCALTGGQPDRVPMFDFLYSQELYEEAIGRRPEAQTAVDSIECTRALGLDAVFIPFGAPSGYEPEFLEEDVYRDEWGTTYKKDPSISWPIDGPIDFPIKSRQDLRDFVLPDPTLPERLVELEQANELARGEIAIMGAVQGPLSQSWMLLGAEKAMIDLHDDPDLVEDVFRLSNEYWIEAGIRMVEAELVDVMCVGEDLGHDAGPFFSPRHYRQHLKPYFDEIVDAFVSRGVPVMLHSCGNVNLLVDEFVNAGISGIHPLQRTARMDLAEMKRKYGDRISLVGNIDSSLTLPYGTEEDVEREVIEAIEIAAPGGGYILASDHSLHDGIPMRNIWKMFETGKKYGKYPLSVG